MTGDCDRLNHGPSYWITTIDHQCRWVRKVASQSRAQRNPGVSGPGSSSDWQVFLECIAWQTGRIANIQASDQLPVSQVGRYGNIASCKIEKQVASRKTLGHQLVKLILHTPQRHVQMHKTHFLSSPQSVLGPLMYRTKQGSARSWGSKITLG